MISLLRCPLCRERLQQNAQGIACESHHQFDKAREGYFNLLPVQNKNSLDPGDTKGQLKARREFLQAGFFDPLKSKILSLLDPSTKTILDLGCGEGYFTRGFSTHLPDAEVYGVDIAKAGIAMAAKATKSFSNVTHVVASNFDLPLQDQSMDVILRILAPSKDSELERILKSDGKLFIVIPGDHHLSELRKKIYQEIRPLQPLPTIEGFTLIQKTTVKFPLEVKQVDQVQSLLDMTPFAWKLNQEKKNSLISGKLNDVADFLIGEYGKKQL